MQRAMNARLARKQRIRERQLKSPIPVYDLAMKCAVYSNIKEILCKIDDFPISTR